ncbi:MAG: hypothetical protein ACJ8AI_34205, partial [Rhodopila sp.]
MLQVSFTGSDARRLVNSTELVSQIVEMGWGAQTQTFQTLFYDDIVDSITLDLAHGAQTAVADDYGPPPYSPTHTDESVVTNILGQAQVFDPRFETHCYVGVTPCPEGLSYTGDAKMNAPWTALGTPAISIPMPVGDALPLGLQ